MEYPFSEYLYRDENQVVGELIDRLHWPDDLSAAVSRSAAQMVLHARNAKKPALDVEGFFQEFSLNTDEGLAMMELAEALLRVPDARTANALIKDKVFAVNWLQGQGFGSKDWKVKLAGLGMALTSKTLDSVFSKLGQPVVREAMVRAMQMMGKQFVLGTSIDDAVSNAHDLQMNGYRLSYDMLGEGARDARTAEHYFQSYMGAIDFLLVKNGQNSSQVSGISVKLSALHPRYTYAQSEFCLPLLIDKMKRLCVNAASGGIPLTIDAEEAHRLDLSVQIFEDLLCDPDLNGWDGLGLAVQAYQKRAVPLISYLADRARENGRKIQMRLVKGAYWDSEIKVAQENGYIEYPVFTRKCNTDLSYLVCAQEMLARKDVIYPMFATHNAHTIAAIRHMVGDSGVDFEFQCLYGMGRSLYDQIIDQDDLKVSVYAPVGPHKDLLAYLVRRLLENGANSSFVNKLLDDDVVVDDLVCDPLSLIQGRDDYRHASIALPHGIFGQNRLNSLGIDLDNHTDVRRFQGYLSDFKFEEKPCSFVGGKGVKQVGAKDVDRAFDIAGKGFLKWNALDIEERARVIERCADMLEKKMDEFMSILIHEGGKTYADARDEVREAVDFCRYYAMCARKDFDAAGQVMQGYTGEDNRLILHGRGVFVCVSPWNFPLAIFVGQIVAALLAGNAVIAKPASQTRYVAYAMVKMMYQAGVPKDVLSLLLGDGAVGQRLVSDRRVCGVAFTGSTQTAKRIQQALAEHNDAIVPLIAETGGQNAMIVDSTALPEQVVDDVVHSAFGSAGQRCSALRVLYVQEEVADDVIDLLRGAMKELRVGDPSEISTDVGYIIDENAKALLDKHIDHIEQHGSLVEKADIQDNLANNDRIFAPVVYEIPSLSVLKEEVFGPILHVIRFKGADLGQVVDDINSTGFGLTFGLHSRIRSRCTRLAKAVHAGNIYVNRSTTGAVVGVQPFGGMGLSGTGPKAGGPNYLHAFAVEKHICVDTTSSGGNTNLLSLDD